jgi:hypothetical protein
MINEQTPEAGLEEALRRKKEAFVKLEVWRKTLLLKGSRALLIKALEAGTSTADDVRRVVDTPFRKDPRFFGKVSDPLTRERIMHCVGHTRSTRPEAHGREIKVWAVVDREAALAWLRSHPDPDSPAPGEQLTLFDGQPLT